MRVLHTSDWHLGKNLDKFSRIDEQINFLEELIKISEEYSIDVILIAGDLFDTYNPPARATEIFYKYLKKLGNDGKRPIVAIAGNHDSPDRIEAPDPLARECGILFIGYPETTPGKYKLDSGVEVLHVDSSFIELSLPQYTYPIRIIAFPYSNEVRLKKYLPIQDREFLFREYLESIWNEIADKYCDSKGINVLMTHVYMEDRNSGPPILSESEKPILDLYGSEKMYTENLPKKIQYAALGHLHRFQVLTEKPYPVVYSGSPIAYSVSESDQDKCVVLIDLEPRKKAKYEKLIIRSGRKILKRKFNNIDEAVLWLSEHKEVFVELTIKTDNFLSARDNKRLYEVHDRILSVIPESSAYLYTEKSFQQINLSKSIEELFIEYYKFKKGGLMPSDSILNLFKETISVEQE